MTGTTAPHRGANGTGEVGVGAAGLPNPGPAGLAVLGRSGRARRRHADLTAPEELRRFGGGAVGPFSQMLLIGLCVCALSLPLFPAVPALAAAVRQLERHLSARDDSLRAFWRSFVDAFRSGGWWVGLGTTAVLGLLAVNASGSFQGLVPGGAAVGWVSVAAGVGVLLVVSRAAALWRPGARWGDLLREAVDVTVADPVGSVLVLTGYGVAAVVVWMLPPLVVITPGMVTVALVAAERRRHGAA